VVRPDKSALGARQRLEFLVQGLPKVSATLSVRLLEHFGTMQTIANASKEELADVRGIGDKTAQGIHDIMRTNYRKKDGEKENEHRDDARD
jgi:Fanconi anemia group M protein